MKKNFFVISLVLFFILKSLCAVENKSQIIEDLQENIQNFQNKNQLLMILENKDPIVCFLQEKGADIGRINDNGKKFLYMAMGDGSLEYALLLMNSIILEDCIECIKALDIVDINTPDINQKTLLMHAIKVNNEEILTILLKKGASIQIYDAKQRNALHYTVDKNPLLIKTILKHFIVPKLNKNSDLIEQKLNYLQNNILSHKNSNGLKPYESTNLSNHPEMQALLNPENTKVLEDSLK